MTEQQSIEFGRYRLSCLLGRGAMATVYRAVLPGPMGFEKQVALKRIHEKITEDKRFVKALVNEARLGGHLRHKNIVEVYEFDEVEGQYFMAMEYIDGWTLLQVLRVCRERDERIPLSVVLSIVEQICEGLDYAHTASGKAGKPLNLVHRDLKPANIMLNRQGEAKIMDFGIAKADTNLYETSSGRVTKGTPVYMSPEQVRGGRLDARSDIFSLGSIIYELLTLKRRFEADNLISIMHAVLNSETAELLLGLPREAGPLTPVLERCMARDLARRYDSARQLGRQIAVLREDLPRYPTLGEWIDSMARALPEPPAAGDFGANDEADGGGAVAATMPLFASPVEGTQSLADASRPEAAESDFASTPMDYDEDAQVTLKPEPEAGGPPTHANRADVVADQKIGKTALDSLTTHEMAPLPHHERKVPGPTPTTEPLNPSATAKRSPTSMDVFLALVLTLCLAGALMWVFTIGPVEPIPEPKPLEPEPAPVSESTAATAAPEAGRPQGSRPTGTGAIAPGPAPQEARSPEQTGWLSLDSTPPSIVSIDGSAVGPSPIEGLEVLPGNYEALFDCRDCSPPQQQTLIITVAAGKPVRRSVRFEDKGN